MHTCTVLLPAKNELALPLLFVPVQPQPIGTWCQPQHSIKGICKMKSKIPSYSHLLQYPSVLHQLLLYHIGISYCRTGIIKIVATIGDCIATTHMTVTLVDSGTNIMKWNRNTATEEGGITTDQHSMLINSPIVLRSYS